MTDWTGAGVIGAATDWQLAIGGDYVTAAILLNAVVTSAGDPKATLYYQTATTRTDAPGAWTAVTTGLILSGGTLENAKANISLVSVTAGRMWIRFGVFLQPDAVHAAPGARRLARSGGEPAARRVRLGS